jgi:hypothetical protein
MFRRLTEMAWQLRCGLGGSLLSPHPEGFGASATILIGGHQMTTWTEVAIDEVLSRKEALCLPG